MLKTEFVKWLPSIIKNVITFGGLSMLFIGLWWERPSVALVVVGLILFVSGVWSLRNAMLDG